MESSIATPPHEEHQKAHSHRRSTGGSKTAKTAHRAPKRVSSTNHGHAHAHSPHHDGDASPGGADSRNKRVWKACERCRMKKTKCDGEFPCKRCKDDGLVCTAGTRKKTEYKQLPKGYAEVLENTQFALIATVHKLYSMVRNGQAWELGEPELNDRGQPVIHNIASRLGCIRPNSDMDLPVHSVFPEDEAGLADLARRLEEQQQHEGDAGVSLKHETDSSDHASSPDLDHSDFERDYRRSAFGSGGSSTMTTMSPQSLTYQEFEPPTSAVSDTFSRTSPTIPLAYPTWMAAGSRPASMAFSEQYLPTSNPYMDIDMLNQGLLESNFGTIKPHMLSCPNPEVMMGMGDPMICSTYNGESLPL